MCDFETSVSVWAHNFNPAWTVKNAGCTDVLLVTGIARDKADGLVGSLQGLYQDSTLEIRDIHNVCLWAEDTSLIGQKRDARNRASAVNGRES